MVIDMPGAERGAALRRRYLALILQALRATHADRLPGPAAAERDLTARWQSKEM